MDAYFVIIPADGQRWFYVGAGGTCLQIHLLPRQIQKLAEVISEVEKCSEVPIFRGSAPVPAGGAYSAPSDPITDG